MNIVLIGMPGSGKSTIGVLVAKALVMDFVDTDLLIQQEYQMSLCKIIDKYGIDKFKEIENDVICANDFEVSVVATGGSAVYGDAAMKKLGMNGRRIYLKLSPEDIAYRIKNINTRGIAMRKGCTIEQLYAERANLYEKYADFTIDCTNLSVEMCVDKIVEYINDGVKK